MILALVAASLLVAQDESSREADMFGEAPPAKTSTITTATAAQEREMTHVAPAPIIAGGEPHDPRDPLAPSTNDREVDSKLTKANDMLDIGAFMYLRAEYDAFSEGKAYRFPFISSNLFDVYLDGRPSDRIRAFVQGRLYYTPTARNAEPLIPGFDPPQELEPLLDQLWLKADIERAVFITAGRQRLKWGSGHAWNPTDFLNDVRNPLDIFDARIGQDLIKLHVPVESLGWNFYALGVFSAAHTPEDIGGAARAEFVLGPTEIALSAAARKDRPLRLGADLSAAIGPFDIHSEAAILRHVTTPFYYGNYDDSLLINEPMSISRKDDTLVQWVNGIEMAIKYSDQDSVYLGAEYFYNGAGYSNSELYRALIAHGAYQPFYVGKHYAALFASLPSPGNWNDSSFTVSALSNLSDRSGVVRIDFTTLLLSYLHFNAFVQMHGGQLGEFRLQLDIPPNPLVPDGAHIPPPLVSVGVGLSVEI